MLFYLFIYTHSQKERTENSKNFLKREVEREREVGPNFDMTFELTAANIAEGKNCIKSQNPSSNMHIWLS